MRKTNLPSIKGKKKDERERKQHRRGATVHHNVRKGKGNFYDITISVNIL